MKHLAFIPLLLAGCATFKQPPADLSAIHAAAKSRITYDYYVGRDYRYIRPGTTGTGNCAVNAFTEMVDATQAGYSAEIVLCRLPDGTGHAYTKADGWALDVRYKFPLLVEDEDCK